MAMCPHGRNPFYIFFSPEIKLITVEKKDDFFQFKVNKNNTM